MKKVLLVTVTRKNGDTFGNPLKLSEAHLVSKLAQENESLKVKCVKVTNEWFKSTFG